MPDRRDFVKITPQKRTAIVSFHENAAIGMYQGFSRRMASDATSPEIAKKRLADVFQQARTSAKSSP